MLWENLDISAKHHCNPKHLFINKSGNSLHLFTTLSSKALSDEELIMFMFFFENAVSLEKGFAHFCNKQLITFQERKTKISSTFLSDTDTPFLHLKSLIFEILSLTLFCCTRCILAPSCCIACTRPPSDPAF